ncbi:hypothetical protein ACFQL0_21300 [Haloplanus litoreus]|uniref:hypothetical protein n=1 Tax=Haloplanus litoreus TaxID=767515 RepID=UPI003613E216
MLPPERFQDESDDEDDASSVDADNLLAAAMGDDLPTKEPSEEGSIPSTTSTGPSLAMPTSALPLGQLDAMAPAERRRAARKRGLEWPTTDEARDRLFETIAEVMREGDERVVDAPTSLGKTYTVASTRWGARDEITGDNQVVHLLATRDARDEAVEVAEEDGGEHFVLEARHEACPVAAGDHDPHPESDDDREVITTEGEAASEWLAHKCDAKGIPFSAAHRYLEDHNDQGAELPCSHDGECPAIQQWEDLREGDHPLVIATHNFAHVPGLRMGTNLVFDEEPDFVQDLTTDRVRDAVAAYLQAIDAPVTSWEAFVQLSRGDSWGDDAGQEREALKHMLDAAPDREWYFEEPRAHVMAPALARAIFHAEERSNGRRVGKTPYEPPRLDAHAHDDEGWNRSWVTIVLDDQNDVQTVRATPDLNLCRSVIGLDAHPALPKWQANTVPHMQRTQVLDPEERRLWRRYERGLRVVQVGTATRPLTKGEYFDDRGFRAIASQLRGTYGERFRTAITAKSVEDRVASIMNEAGVHDPKTMHYGEEKSRNDFADEPIGLVEGVIDPGDDHVVNLLAELDLDAKPERSEGECEHCEGEGCRKCLGTGQQRAHGRGFTGEDADTAREILASVRENHVAQAAGRYARNPDDPDSTATVYVRTDAMPTGFADVQTPGVVWTFGQKQDRIVEELREAAEPLSARVLADRAECSKEHVRQTMRRFEDEDGDHDVQVFESVGEHGATLYAATGLPNSGVVDVGSPTEAYGSIYTWGLAIRDPNPIETDDDQPDGPASAETRTFWEPLGGVDPGGTGG